MTLPVDPVIEKLRSEGLCHKNELTGCEVWTGAINRKGQPVYGTLQARDYMYQAASGEVVRRGEEVQTVCENDRCILPAHFRKVSSPPKPQTDVPDDHITAMNNEYFNKGRRLDTIAETAGWSQAYAKRVLSLTKKWRADAGSTVEDDSN